MKKFDFIVDFVWTILTFILICYNIFMGINNHDAYYLTLGILFYLYLGFQNNLTEIKKYIDKKNNM